MLDNIVPPNTFEATNLADKDGYVFLGKGPLVTTNNIQPLTNGSNCLSTFLFGSIKPGKNIRIDVPTDKDPNLFIDAKFFDFNPYSSSVSLCSSNVLYEVSSTSGDMHYFFRGLINDGSVDDKAWTIIEADDESFYVGYDGVTYYKQVDGTYTTNKLNTNPSAIVLKEHSLNIKNATEYLPNLFTHKLKDEYGNTTFYLNKLIAGNCMNIVDNGDTLTLHYDYSCARKTPCCDDSHYSGAGIYDPVSSSSDFIPGITCSSYATTYLVGYDFKEKLDIPYVYCDGGFCNWLLDTYTYSTSSAHLDLNDPLSPVVPYLIRSGMFYKVTADEISPGTFNWNLRIMKYSTYYSNCIDDEFSDYFLPLDRDHDKQENKVVRQDVQMLVLTLSESGSPVVFDRSNMVQPTGIYTYNKSETQSWISSTTPPEYEGSSTHLIMNISELFLDGPFYDRNDNTKAGVTAISNCAPYVVSSSSSLSDSNSMGSLQSSSSHSSHSSWSSWSSHSSHSSKSSQSSNSSQSFSSSSQSSMSSQSNSQTSESSSLASDTLYTVLIVMDGARYSDTFGSPMNIPSLMSITTSGAYNSSLYADNPATETIAGHDAMLTGRYEPISNTGSQNPSYPSFIQEWLYNVGIVSTSGIGFTDRAKMIFSKDKLLCLGKSTTAGSWNDYLPYVNAGVNGDGTGGYRTDANTFNIFKVHCISGANPPQLSMVSFAEPDTYAHAVNYSGYISAIQQTDAYIGEIWNTIQSHPLMANKTMMIVTNDHGRQADPNFDQHGGTTEPERHVMFVAIGPDIKSGYTTSTYRGLRDIPETIMYVLGMTKAYGDGNIMTEILK
jgi:hypothetical protein